MLEKLLGIPVTRIVHAGVRLAHPSLANVVVRDRLGASAKPRASRQHLDSTMKWLCCAHDHAGGRGVSSGYSIIDGWLPPYPETTGYIIPTFYDYAQITGMEEFRARAGRMADWEIEVQLDTGAVQAGIYKGEQHERQPAVFNTGQVILGWGRAFVETQDSRYLEGAQRAGDWLCDVQSPDGSWQLDGQETETNVHAYDVRTAWSLLELHQLTGQARYADTAGKNLEWALAQRERNGWFNHNAFFVSSDKWTLPLTHTIAYVMEGLLESWRITNDGRYFQAVQQVADKLLRVFELQRFMPGEFDSAWKSTAHYSCLTGNAQIAGVWLRIYQSTHDTRFLNAALKLNDYVKSTQSLSAWHAGIRGGVKGSQPIFGEYTPFIYVNWGAKFLADSLMLEEKVMAEFQRAVLGGEHLGPRDLEQSISSESNQNVETQLTFCLQWQ